MRASHRRPALAATALVASALAAALVPSAAAQSPSGADQPHGPKPTVVLVHGAFADASGWKDVVNHLQDDGFQVLAPPNPLRGPHTDAAYVASLLRKVKGPKVVVGHSYGGAVISEAAAGDRSVRALVYVSAFMPDKGETLGALGDRFPGSQLNQALVQLPDGRGGTDVAIDPRKFRAVFAADVPRRLADAMAVSQRPIAAGAFTDAATAAAWRSLPSWALVARQDRTISPDLERFEARRAHSHTVETDSSHVAMISHPGLVTRLIESAAAATSRRG